MLICEKCDFLNRESMLFDLTDFERESVSKSVYEDLVFGFEIVEWYGLEMTRICDIAA